MAEVHSNNSALTEYMIYNKTRANSLSDVRTLNMWGYDLRDVSIFQEMPNVEVVSLSMNEISTLKDFTFCPKLRELLLRHNSISNLSEIQYLSNLKNLRRLWLAENPIANQENYRDFVISNLPQLEILDEKPITEEERNGFVHMPKIEIENHDNGEIFHHKHILPNDFVKKNFDSPTTNRRKRRFINDDVIKHEMKCNYNRNENVDYGNVQENFQENNFKYDQQKNEEASLTAVLALLPGLSANSIGIVLDAISKLSE